MNFENWFDKNCDKLEEKYEEYVEILENNDIVTPMSFDEFVQDKWDSFDFYTKREERE